MSKPQYTWKDLLTSLPPEELAKVPPLSEEVITKAIEQGRRERELASQTGSLRMIPLFFRNW